MVCFNKKETKFYDSKKLKLINKWENFACEVAPLIIKNKIFVCKNNYLYMTKINGR
jgi:hypothetical protein